MASETSPAGTALTPRRLIVMALAAGAGALALALNPLSGNGAGPDSGGNSEPASFSADDVRQIGELPLIAARLRDRLRDAPSDPDGWALLGRTHARLGEYVQAGAAFRKSLALRPGDAGVLVDYADTAAFVNKRSFEGEPMSMIEKALRIDPRHAGALMLSGLAAFDRKDYGKAVADWERVRAVAKPGSDVHAHASEGVAEARKRMAGTGGAS